MGRPKGSKNNKVKKNVKLDPLEKIEKIEKKTKLKKEDTKTAYKKKQKQKYSKYSNLPDDYVEPPTLKFAGHCPECDMSLTTKDFVTKTIFECIGCGCRKHKKYLLKESKSQKERKMISKKQYLKESANLTKDKESHTSDLPNIPNIPNISIMNDIKE